mgnify:CR=1 FL=1
MIIKDHITGKIVHIKNNGNMEIYLHDIIQRKYNENINIPTVNQVELIQNNIKILYEKRKSKSSIF